MRPPMRYISSAHDNHKNYSNPQDWAFNRLEMEKRGMKYDYTTIDTKQIALTVTWGSGVVLLAPWYFSKVFLPMM